MRILRTKEVSTLISKSTRNKVDPETVRLVLEIFADTISAAMAKDYHIQVNRLGIFKTNSKGWIRFRPGRTMKERYRRLKERE